MKYRRFDNSVWTDVLYKGVGKSMDYSFNIGTIHNYQSVCDILLFSDEQKKDNSDIKGLLGTLLISYFIKTYGAKVSEGMTRVCVNQCLKKQFSEFRSPRDDKQIVIVKNLSENKKAGYYITEYQIIMNIKSEPTPEAMEKLKQAFLNPVFPMGSNGTAHPLKSS